MAASKPTSTILDAMADPALFAPWFRGESWQPWKAFLSAVFALPLETVALEAYQRHTSRQNAPGTPSSEAWLVVGRRGGKSLIAALLAVFLACFRDYRHLLVPGERGTVMVIAADRRQARVVFRYIAGFFDGIPLLRQMVESRTKDSIDLSNRVTIEIHTSSFRAIRGYTVVAAVCDEIAFWADEDSANPDTEILNGLRPGMATIPNSLLLCISSPYARRGALWEAYRDHYGKDGDPVLVWQADTRSMNTCVDERIIAAAYDADESAAGAEYGAQFRRDIESFISREAIEAAVIPGRHELPSASEIRYQAFVDPSGGSADSFTVAIAHLENGKAILDCVRESRPPFSPEAVVADYAETLRGFSIRTVEGDHYAGEWPREQFRKRGIEYTPAERSKSEIYLELLPAINSGKLALLDSKRLISQLAGLERRTARGGRDSVDHAPGSHDDLVNAAAGALLLALKSSSTGHGLLDLWEQQAKALKARQTQEIGHAQRVAPASHFEQVGGFVFREGVIKPPEEPQEPCPCCGRTDLARGLLWARCLCGWKRSNAEIQKPAPRPPLAEPPTKESFREKDLLPDFLLRRWK